MSRLASVYPIVSARSLARLFTYEIGDEVGKGAVLAIPFGNARRRGVVVDADAEAPPDVAPVLAERVLETVINWGRHAEIFAYDYDTEVLSLENF